METENDLRPGVNFEINHEEFLAKATDREGSAFQVASEIHKGNVRKSTGEPYINHCMTVMEILRQWGADEDLRVAALLHDTVEDHPDKISIEDIRSMFGERVAHLVDGVSGKNDDVEDHRKVAREAQTELGIVLLKCADRLHNLMTMNGFDEKKKVKKAKETLAVYVPMAESLGLWQIKNALADIAFSLADPKKYEEVRGQIDGDRRLNSGFIRSTKERIGHILDDAGLRATVEHQVGGYWELFEKKKKTRKEYRDITDVISFRVIFDDEENLGECYRGLGVVRTVFGKAICLNRSDDYLAVPARNLYSALHDTYKFDEGNIEIAFTTQKREAFNNRGVASLRQEEIERDMEKYKKSLSGANNV